MPTTDFIASIELSSSRISGIAGKKNNDGSINVLAYASEGASSFIHRGVIFNIDKAAQALTSIVNQLETQLNNSIAKVYVGIGGQSLRSITNVVERKLDEEVKISQPLIDAICDENLSYPIADMDILDVAPQEYQIDGVMQIDPVGVTGKHIIGNFLNIVARTNLKKNLEHSFSQARINIADIIVSPKALAHAVITENEMRSGCALVDFGADTTTVSVYKNNILRYLSVLPLGGNTITRDITILQMEEEEAEKLKLQYGDAAYADADGDEDGKKSEVVKLEDGRTAGKNELGEIISARAEEILTNVWHQIQLSGYEDKLLAGVIFTGGASNLKNLEAVFEKLNEGDFKKVRVAKFGHIPVHGNPAIKKDGSMNTLIGLLEMGRENCCLEEKPNQGIFATTYNPEEEAVEEIVAETVAVDTEEEKQRALEKEREREAELQRKLEQKKAEEEEKRRRKEEARQKRKFTFEKIFGRITDEIFSNDSMDDNPNK